MFKFKDNKGQNAVEYMLIFAIVSLVMVIGLAPNGFITQTINHSVDQSFVALEGITNSFNSDY